MERAGGRYPSLDLTDFFRNRFLDFDRGDIAIIAFGSVGSYLDLGIRDRVFQTL